MIYIVLQLFYTLSDCTDRITDNVAVAPIKITIMIEEPNNVKGFMCAK